MSSAVMDSFARSILPGSDDVWCSSFQSGWAGLLPNGEPA